MSEFIESFIPFSLVAIGAVLGSATRVYLTGFLEGFLPAKHWGTMIVNISAAFMLGLFISLHSPSGLDHVVEISSLLLFFSVGFLGSMSTFSTFVFDLFKVFQAHRWKEFFCLASFSIFGGFMAVAAGFVMGDV